MYLPALADDTPQTAVTISDDIIAGVLQRIYHNRYGKRGDDGIDTRLYDATREVFNRASAEGIASAVDNNIKMPSDTFLRRMDRNNAVFSAFRTHRMQRDLAAMMYDGKGKVKPFDTFRRDVAPVVGKYRTDWLRTEYTTAVQRSRLAAQWQQYADEADVYPNLEWVPSTSPNPGADHRIFWGVRQPVDSPFWDRHRPGDRWNCQCDLRQSDDEPTDPPMDPIDDNNSPAPGLDNNPGKDAVIFNDSHPYFPKSCASCPFAPIRKKRFLSKNCYGCALLHRNITQNEVEIDGVIYRVVEYTSGGRLEYPVDGGQQNKNEKRNNEKAAKELASLFGEKLRLLPVKNVSGKKNPDVYDIERLCKGDIKCPITNNGKNAIQSAIREASKQNVEEVFIYLLDNINYNMRDIYKGLKAALMPGRAKGIKLIVIRFSRDFVKYYEVDKVRRILHKK